LKVNREVILNFFVAILILIYYFNEYVMLFTIIDKVSLISNSINLITNPEL